MRRLIYKLQKKWKRSCASNINYETMKNMLNKNQRIVVIDVRTRDEYLNKHLDGAINIPLQDIVRES